MDWDGLLDDMTAAVRDVFGEPVLYRRTETGEDHEIHGVFDPDFKELEAGGTMPTLSKIPVLDVRVDDLGFEPSTEDRVTVGGKRYRIMSIWPSSSGMVKLQLRRS